MKQLICMLMLLACVNSLKAQETSEESTEKHFLGLALSYSYVPKGTSLEGSEADGVFVPAIGIDYLYKLHSKLGIGAMIDLELADYLIFEKDLNRSRAFILTSIVAYKPLSKITLFSGPGYEIEKHHNLFLFRFGMEYGFPLKNKWELASGFFYDIKEGYDTWSLGVAIGKGF